MKETLKNNKNKVIYKICQSQFLSTFQKFF